MNHYEVEPYGLIHKGSEAHKLLEAGKVKEFQGHMKKLVEEAIKRGEVLEFKKKEKQ